MSSSIEWLIKSLSDRMYIHCPEFGHSIIDKLVEQAKEMHKQEIIEAYYQCGKDNFEHIKVINRSATEYYQETFQKVI